MLCIFTVIKRFYNFVEHLWFKWKKIIVNYEEMFNPKKIFI